MKRTYAYGRSWKQTGSIFLGAEMTTLVGADNQYLLLHLIAGQGHNYLLVYDYLQKVIVSTILIKEQAIEPADDADNFLVTVSISENHLAAVHLISQLEIILIDLTTGQVVETIESPDDNTVTNLAINAPGKVVCLLCDNCLFAYQRKAGLLGRLNFDATEQITCLRFNHRNLYIGTGTGKVFQFDLLHQSITRTFSTEISDVLTHMVLSPDGLFLAAADSAHANIIDTRDNQIIANVDVAGLTNLHFLCHPLIIFTRHHNTPQVFNFETQTYSDFTNLPRIGWQYNFCPQQRGNTIIFDTGTLAVRACELNVTNSTAETTTLISGPGSDKGEPILSPAGNFICWYDMTTDVYEVHQTPLPSDYAAAPEYRPYMTIENTAGEELVNKPETTKIMAFSPNGEYLAIFLPDKLVVVDVAKKTEKTLSLQIARAQKLCWSSDNRYVILRIDGKDVVVDIVSAKIDPVSVYDLEKVSHKQNIAIGADGKLYAVVNQFAVSVYEEIPAEMTVPGMITDMEEVLFDPEDI